jgi:hypothetical protein
MTKDKKSLFKDNGFPLCLQKAVFVILKQAPMMYNAPNASLQTKKHRIISSYKPVSKIFFK